MVNGGETLLAGDQGVGIKVAFAIHIDLLSKTLTFAHVSPRVTATGTLLEVDGKISTRRRRTATLAGDTPKNAHA